MTRRRPRRSRNQQHGIAWWIAASTIRALIGLSAESYAAYRQMRKRLQQADQGAPLAESRRPSDRAAKAFGATVEPVLTASMTDAILALTGLGFRRTQAERAVKKVALTLGVDGSAEQFIKLGLKTLTK